MFYFGRYQWNIDHLFNLFSLLLDDVSHLARNVSRIKGTFISMEHTLGQVAIFPTQALYTSKIAFVALVAMLPLFLTSRAERRA